MRKRLCLVALLVLLPGTAGAKPVHASFLPDPTGVPLTPEMVLQLVEKEARQTGQLPPKAEETKAEVLMSPSSVCYPNSSALLKYFDKTDQLMNPD